MTLPYLQVGRELLDHVAFDLGAILEVSEAEAAWMAMRLWEYGISKGRPETPPDGRVEGANAAQRIESRVGWHGQPGRFVAAAMDPEVNLLMATDGGFRIKGMERYAGAWKKKHRPGPSKRDADESAKSPQKSGAVEPDKRRTAPSPSPSNASLEEEVQEKEVATPDDLARAWNQAAEGLAQVKEIEGSRKKKAKEALKRRRLEQWREIFTRVSASSFCRGENDRGWEADFDWAIRGPGHKGETAVKVLEGAYDNRKPKAAGAPRNGELDVGRGRAPTDANYDPGDPFKAVGV